MSEFRMPSLGTDMEAGTLVEWMKQPGERVQRGEAIAAVETQKGAIEIECFQSGVLERIVVEVGQRVPVGTVLAIIRTEGEPPGAGGIESQPKVVAPPTSTAAATAGGKGAEPTVSAAPRPGSVPPTEPVSSTAARFTPVALRRAQALGLDIAALRPAADGIIGLRDVEAAGAAAPASAAVPPPRAALPHRAGPDTDAMRQAIAAAMTRAWREIPHYGIASTLDLEPLLAWLAQRNAAVAVPERLHYAVPLIRAVALALREVGELNGHYRDGRFEAAPSVHLGIAIALRGGGLIAPAIEDADRRDLPDLMRCLNDLVARVRGGRLRSGEMSRATATLTNLGEGTADTVQGIIYPPQVALIGCGQIVERVLPLAGVGVVRRCVTVSVAGDHRVSDGRSAARFLFRLGQLLLEPEHL